MTACQVRHWVNVRLPGKDDFGRMRTCCRRDQVDKGTCGRLTMALHFRLPKSSVAKKRRNLSQKNESIPANHVIDAVTLPRNKRHGHLLLTSGVSSIVVAGKRTLLLKKTAQKRALGDPLAGDADIDLDVPDPEPESFTFPIYTSSDNQRARNRERAHTARQRLASRWRNEVLPRVLPIYLMFQANRAFAGMTLRTWSMPERECTCTKLQVLRIVVVRWDCEHLHSSDAILMLLLALGEIEVTICQCRPAPDQLIAQGLFPCAPIQPSLAADIKLLEFMSASSIHLTLNLTGWASLLEEFWELNGFALKFEVSRSSLHLY
jgi:hypothetical protein